MSTPAEKVSKDVAAEVAAPGQEAFKTPDIAAPADKVSDDPDRFGEEVDWSQVLDEDNSEPVDQEEPLAATPSEDEPKIDAPASVATPEAEVDQAPAAVTDEDAAAAVVADEDEEFQPAALDTHPAEEPNEDWKAEYVTQKTAARDEIQKRYEFSQEDIDEFTLNPEKVLPRMAAQVYVDTFESVLAAVSDMLPARVTQLNGQNLLAAQRTEEFYEAWPGLKTVEGQEKIMAIGAVYREMNKTATPEEFIRDVGTQASIALQIPIPGITDNTRVSESAPAPHTPAAPAGQGAGLVVASEPSNNQFEVLERTWEDE